MGMSEFAKYAWFFICYSLLNAVLDRKSVV